eukprot:2257416-Amphidinium_carterae.1
MSQKLSLAFNSVTGTKQSSRAPRALMPLLKATLVLGHRKSCSRDICIQTSNALSRLHDNLWRQVSG